MSNDPRPCVPGPPLKTNNGHLCLVQNKCCAIIYVPGAQSQYDLAFEGKWYNIKQKDRNIWKLQVSREQRRKVSA